MFDTADSPRQTFRPEMVFTIAQKNASCWSRAYTHLLEGFMSAASAQADLARTMLTTEHAEWPGIINSGNASEVTHRWLTGNKKQLDAMRRKYRQIDDGLTASFFAAADSLLEGLSIEEATLPDALKTTSAVEKKPTAPAKEKIAAE
ncbi:hypothetical protein GCM10010909_15680 [Acidocella aquatica]|uniref:Phasin domain-containing protein n=1 Tax=Acidocella aquatica TaxID=1922313 RepID=A0ABQ6A9I4_9PROT|nr:hypothetical protein [Acidocella aquatica]GLR66888.1 hypothetical protein GCM10010909_15680 [Acidocella aquatica]